MTPKSHAETVGHIFLEHSLTLFRILSKLLTDKGPRFACNVSVAECSTLGGNNIIITEYHPQQVGQADTFNTKIMSRLCHYM